MLYRPYSRDLWQNASIRTSTSLKEREISSLNRAVTEARHEILVFSDANTILNKEAVRYIARHYRMKK